MVKMQASRWRCLNGECERRTFTERCSTARNLLALTLVGPNELLNLFISSAAARAGSWGRD